MEKQLLKDEVVTKLLTDKECIDYLLKIISASIGIPFTEIKENFELVDIRVGASTKIKDAYADIVAQNKDYIFDVEVNYNPGKRADNKNMSYICNLLLRQLKVGNKYKYEDLVPVTQININNYDYFKQNKFIYTSQIIEKDLHLVRSDLLKIIDVNVIF